MVTSRAATVADYLAELAPDRRAAIEAVRRTILANLPDGFEEGMWFGMIGYYVPLARYPDTYNGQPLGVAALASQKNAMSLYLMNVYGDPETERWFVEEYRKTGKRLDMGKSCVRFATLDALPLELVGRAIARTSVEAFLATYERSRAATASGRRAAAKKPAAKKPAAKKPAAKKPAAEKARRPPRAPAR